MDNENNEFPKYEPSESAFLANDTKSILKDWKLYLDEISTCKPRRVFITVTGIIRIIDKLLYWYDSRHFTIDDYYVDYFNSNLIALHKHYIDKNYATIGSILHKMLEHFLSLKNTVHLDNIEDENSHVSENIRLANYNLDASKNILELSNLKGLAGEFELQYNQYNSERKFWGVSIVAILSAILFRTIDITINPMINISVASCYIIGFLLLFLWISPNSVNKLMNLFFKNKSFLNTNTLHRRITIIQIALILGVIELAAVTLLTILNMYHYGITLKLFSVTVNNINYSNWNDWFPELSLYIPLIWALWFSIKQYHYTLKLMNAYRFKMALSLAYNGYKEECDELGNTDHKEHLMHEVLTVVADDPTKRDFKDTHMPWSEVKEIFNIVSKNK